MENKEIVLIFNSKDGTYRNSIIMERELILLLKNNEFLNIASSFEDISNRFSAEVFIYDQDLDCNDHIQIHVSTLVPLPESWKKGLKRNLNLDLMDDHMDSIVFSFYLSLEYITPYSNGEYLLIEIPLINKQKDK